MEPDVLSTKPSSSSRRETARRLEKILKVNPRFAPAANNLAWLLGEQAGGIWREPFSLPRSPRKSAQRIQPSRTPWDGSSYKRGIHQRAVVLFKESAARLPDNPVVQYHLGLAYLQADEKDNARSALAAAVGSPGISRVRRRPEERRRGSISGDVHTLTGVPVS